MKSIDRDELAFFIEFMPARVSCRWGSLMISSRRKRSSMKSGRRRAIAVRGVQPLGGNRYKVQIVKELLRRAIVSAV